MSARGRWYLTETAVRQYCRIWRWPDDDAHFARAEDEMLELSGTAALKDTDRNGLQLWRSGRPMNLRWLVSPAPRKEGDKPQVIWVGQGAPRGAWAGAAERSAGRAPVQPELRRSRSGPNITDEQRKTERLNLRIDPEPYAQLKRWQADESEEYGDTIPMGEIVEDLVHLRRAIDAIDPDLRVQFVWSRRKPGVEPAPTAKDMQALARRRKDG